jgi:exonuclease I
MAIFLPCTVLVSVSLTRTIDDSTTRFLLDQFVHLRRQHALHIVHAVGKHHAVRDSKCATISRKKKKKKKKKRFFGFFFALRQM